MRHKVLLILTFVLVMCATAWGQARLSFYSGQTVARAGGKAELAGDVFLFSAETSATDDVTLTLRYNSGSVVSKVTEIMYGAADSEMPFSAEGTEYTATVDDGTVTLTGLTVPAAGGSLRISGIRLDVSEATGQVSVHASVSGDDNPFFTSETNRVVIASIDAPLVIPEGSLKATNINPLGGGGMTTFTVKEGFGSALRSGDGNMMTLTVQGIPDKATLYVGLGSTTFPGDVVVDDTILAKAVEDDAETLEADESADAVRHKVVSSGAKITLEIELKDGAGGDNTPGTPDDVALNVAVSDTLSLVLELDAGPKTKGLVIPLTGSADAWYAMAPDEKFVPMQVGGDVFTFKPATCSLLFPYGLVHAGFNTGITVSNTSMYAGSSFDGNLEFTFYANGADPEEDPLMLMTGPDQGGMYGLNEEGNLAGGNTFTILLSEALAEAEHDGGFVGHFVIKSNFMPCAGLGWVTDFMSVNQAYVAMTP